VEAKGGPRDWFGGGGGPADKEERRLMDVKRYLYMERYLPIYTHYIFTYI
jgi:hypothetical protein